MSKIFGVLKNSGYEFSSSGDDILPGTLMKDGQPIGFLMPDLTVSLVSSHTQHQESIEKALGFAIDNENLNEIESGEYILTQYDKTILTTSYDYDMEQAVYKVYSVSEDKRAIIESYDEKFKATQSFATLSGLINGDVSPIQRDTGIGRINNFIEQITQKGYQLIENHEEAHRRYDITDKDGIIVGYIGANNKLTLSTDAVRHRKTLTDIYYKSSPNKLELPSFFEKLKNKLKEIGLSLKVKLTPLGQHYTINDKRKEIAVVDESEKITYTPFATTEQMQKINNLVSEIQMERNASKTVVEAIKPQTNELANTEIVSSELASIEKVLTAAEIIAIANAVFGSGEPASELSSEIIEKLSSVSNIAVISPAASSPVIIKSELSENQKELLEQFDNDYDLLQTVSGFNDAEYSQVEQMMHSKYGTTDRSIYVGNLTEDKNIPDYKSLNQKLQSSHEKADTINHDKAEKQSQEKER